MPVIDKMRIATAAVIKNALGIIIIIVLLFANLNRRVSLRVTKIHRAVLYLGSISKSFLSAQVINK